MLCAVANISRSAYYRYVTRPERHRTVKEIVMREQEQLGRIYGYRRMKVLLRNKYGIVINHKALRQVMKATGTQAVIRRKKSGAIYHPEGAPRIAENRLNRNFMARRPQQKYVTDITYIPIPGGMAYLSVMLDLYNREVVSYVVSKMQDASLSCQTVEQLARKRNIHGAMIHSDQGVHYTNGEYVGLLQRHGAIQSMSRRGNCWDNAVMENFFGHFKCECIRIRRKALKTFQDVVYVVDEYVEFYNHRRPQTRLKQMAPVAYRRRFA